MQESLLSCTYMYITRIFSIERAKVSSTLAFLYFESVMFADVIALNLNDMSRLRLHVVCGPPGTKLTYT